MAQKEGSVMRVIRWTFRALSHAVAMVSVRALVALDALMRTLMGSELEDPKQRGELP